MYNMIFLGGEGLILMIFAQPIVRGFTHDPSIIPLAVSCLRILNVGNVGYAYGMVMLQAFNGAGDTLTPTVVNSFGFLLFEIPVAYALAIPFGMHSQGVSWAIVVAECFIAVVSVFLFRRGRWKAARI
jgi:Na+-driven multidrug efflux pump